MLFSGTLAKLIHDQAVEQQISGKLPVLNFVLVPVVVSEDENFRGFKGYNVQFQLFSC